MRHRRKESAHLIVSPIEWSTAGTYTLFIAHTAAPGPAIHSERTHLPLWQRG